MTATLWRWRLTVVYAALALTPFFVPAQAPAPAADGTSSDHLRALEQRIDRLAESLSAAQNQVEEDRRKMQSMQAEIDDLRKVVTENGGNNSSPAVANAAAQLQEAVSQIREEQDVLAAQVKQQDQTKVESGSRFPVHLHGLVLFNAFVNEGVVDQPDLPTAALLNAPGQSNGSVGGGLRQTMLSIAGDGPALWNGRLFADVSFDFFGGLATGTGSPAGIVRMRTAGISWQGQNDLVRAGFDAPLISPLSPASYATIAQPALAWSGNLWVWAPQLKWEHLFPVSDAKHVGIELGLYDASYTALDSLSSYRYVSPGEAARQPGYEGRLSYRADREPHALQLGAGGYYDRKNFGAGQTVDAWAGTGDWLLPLMSHWNWSGEFYRGRGIGSLGGGAYRDAYNYLPSPGSPAETSGLDSVGGWTQWQWSSSETMQLNAAFGQDTGYGSELRRSIMKTNNELDYYARNRTLMANFIFRPWSSFVFSPEFRRLNSWPISYKVATANVYTISVGYEF